MAWLGKGKSGSCSLGRAISPHCAALPLGQGHTPKPKPLLLSLCSVSTKATAKAHGPELMSSISVSTSFQNSTISSQTGVQGIYSFARMPWKGEFRELLQAAPGGGQILVCFN